MHLEDSPVREPLYLRLYYTFRDYNLASYSVWVIPAGRISALYSVSYQSDPANTSFSLFVGEAGVGLFCFPFYQRATIFKLGWRGTTNSRYVLGSKSSSYATTSISVYSVIVLSCLSLLHFVQDVNCHPQLCFFSFTCKFAFHVYLPVFKHPHFILILSSGFSSPFCSILIHLWFKKITIICRI